MCALGPGHEVLVKAGRWQVGGGMGTFDVFPPLLHVHLLGQVHGGRLGGLGRLGRLARWA